MGPVDPASSVEFLVFAAIIVVGTSLFVWYARSRSGHRPRGSRGTPGGLGHAIVAVQEIIQPSLHHVIKARHGDEIKKEDEETGPDA